MPTTRNGGLSVAGACPLVLVDVDVWLQTASRSGAAVSAGATRGGAAALATLLPVRVAVAEDQASPLPHCPVHIRAHRLRPCAVPGLCWHVGSLVALLVGALRLTRRRRKGQPAERPAHDGCLQSHEQRLDEQVNRFSGDWWEEVHATHVLRRERSGGAAAPTVAVMARMRQLPKNATRRRLALRALPKLLQALWRLPSEHPLWLIAALLGLANLPLSFGPALWPDDNEAEDFLEALWQVEAAALGILIAAALFVFQSYAGVQGSYGLTLRGFVANTRIMHLVGLLSSALALTGATLLGWGNGAPRGVAAAISLGLAAWALVEIPRLFHHLVAQLEPSRIEKFRQHALTRALEGHLKDLHRTEAMQQCLVDVINRAGGTLSWLRPASSTPYVHSAGCGTVVDVRLQPLRQKIYGPPAGGRGTVVGLQVGASLRRGQDVLVSPSPTTGSQPDDFLILADDVGARTENPAQLLEELHADAMEQVRRHDAYRYGRTLQLYEALFQILIPPGALPTSTSMFSFSLIDSLLRYLQLEFIAAVDQRGSETIQIAGYFPARVRRLAIEAGNADLAVRMTRQLQYYARYEMQAAA